MSKKIWLTGWAMPGVDVEKIVNGIDNSINVQYVTLSDTKYVKRIYDVRCHEKKDIINVIVYFLEQERMIDGDDIEVVAMMLLKKDDESFFTLNVALDYLSASEVDIHTKNKDGEGLNQNYFVKGGILYDEYSTKIKDFNEKLFS